MPNLTLVFFLLTQYSQNFNLQVLAPLVNIALQELAKTFLLLVRASYVKAGTIII